jgi:ABC-type multidrug transport system fused ATPase/permease subunit
MICVLCLVWCFRTHGFLYANILDNIRYGSFDKTEQQVKDAAKAAQVNHFVRTLPGGYNKLLNEEASNYHRDKNNF